ncbi:uncharacterized protein LOC143072860 [Mytilus galloprovincialis]|uniref:uncharacterized protein LOC143072860 n=1 Tax=Mytilus galloprovincialis TaxID=29158 RepID=UPI003F7C4C55
MPGETIQLFLKGLEAKTHTIDIDSNAMISDLFKKVAEYVDLIHDDVRVIYGTKDLREISPNGQQMSITDYNIPNGGNLFLVCRVRGGSNEEEPVLKVYDSDVELTSEPDMFTLDDDEGGQRAKMPCGHAIGPDSLTSYCRSLLTAGKYEFRCPYKKSANDPMCAQLWEFFTVRKLAVLKEEERNEFEIKISENYLRKAAGIQECPKCQTYCERRRKRDVRVICPICSKKGIGLYEFCWYCLKTWIGSGTMQCGNLNCTGEDPRLRILKTCPMKIVVAVPNCPAVRSCPKCGLLIEHTSACKQMVCPCGQKFCFICLKMADATGKYQCGSFNFKCGVAPIQTTVPGSD